MDEFVLPHGPTLTRASIIRCTPDGQLLVCNNDLTIFRRDELNRTTLKNIELKPAKRPHCVVVNDKTYNYPYCYASICGSNNVIILIDLKQDKVKKICNVFTNELWSNSNNDFLVAVSFIEDDVLMISEHGVLGKWITESNKCTILPKILNQPMFHNMRVIVTCMTVCPHDSRYVAIGLKCGIILLLTLDNTKSYPVRKFSHSYEAIYSLVWCPAPFNVRNIKEKWPIVKNPEVEIPKEKKLEKQIIEVEKSETKIAKVEISETKTVEVEKSENNSCEKSVTSLENKSVDWLSLIEESPEKISSDNLSDNQIPQKPRYIEIFNEELREMRRRWNLELANEKTNEKNNEINESSPNVNYSDEEVKSSPDEVFIDETKKLESTIPDNDSSNLENFKSIESYLLLSTSTDGQLRIWDVLQDSSLILNCRLKNKSFFKKKEFNFAPALWLNEQIILFVCGYEVRFFNIKDFQDVGHFKTLHVYHKHSIYAVAAPYQIISLEDMKSGVTDVNEKSIWSIDNCERLVCFPFNRDIKKLLIYSLCKSVINRFSVSQIDHHHIAMCSQTNFISFWSINKTDPYKFNMKYVRLKSPVASTVLCIVFHPKCEYVAAVSLSNGSIHLISIAENTPKIKTIRNFDTNDIYSISWGMYSNINFEKKLCIYAAVNGRILIFDPDSNFDQKPFTIRTDKDVTTVSWNYQFDRLAVGVREGSISFYNKNCEFIIRSYFCKSFIYKLIWHPSCADKNTVLNSTIAVVAKEKNVYVYDSEKPHAKMIVAILKGHEHFVYDACWSPFQSNLLVTASSDYTAKVWDVLTQTQLASFNEHNNELYSVCWHPLYQDMIMSSGLDFTLRFWNYKKHPPALEALSLRKKKLKKNDNLDMMKMENNDVKKPVIEENVIQEQIPENLKKNDVKNNDKNNVDEVDEVDKDDEDDKIDNALLDKVPIISEVLIPKKIDNRLLISSYVQDRTSILDAAYNLLEGDEPPKLNIPNTLIPFFSDDFNDLYDLLNIEQQRCETDKLSKSNESLYIWRSKLEKCIEKNTENNTLSERLIALAPMVSHELWSISCYHFSKQCLLNGEITKAVDYLLVIHKVKEAINVYLNAHLYREAYILAKCHYSPRDIILKNILEKWVKFSFDTGCFEIAGLCLIKLKDYEQAAKILSRRTHNYKVLELALNVAKKTACADLIESISVQLNKVAIVNFASTENGANDPNDVNDATDTNQDLN